MLLLLDSCFVSSGEPCFVQSHKSFHKVGTISLKSAPIFHETLNRTILWASVLKTHIIDTFLVAISLMKI